MGKQTDRNGGTRNVPKYAFHYGVCGLDDMLARLVSAGSDGNDSAKADCPVQSDLSKDSRPRSFSFQESGNRSCGFRQRFFCSSTLVPVVSPFLFVAPTFLSPTNRGLVNSFGLHRLDDRDKIQWWLSYP